MTAQWRSLAASAHVPRSVDVFQMGDDGSTVTVTANGDVLSDVMMAAETVAVTVFTVRYAERGDRRFEVSEPPDFGDASDAVVVAMHEVWIAVGNIDGVGDAGIFIAGNLDHELGGGTRSSVSSVLDLNDGNRIFAC